MSQVPKSITINLAIFSSRESTLQTYSYMSKQTKLCSVLIFTALFVIGKDQKQPKCTPIGEQINYGIITQCSPKKFLICKHETASKRKEQGRAKHICHLWRRRRREKRKSKVEKNIYIHLFIPAWRISGRIQRKLETLIPYRIGTW